MSDDKLKDTAGEIATAQENSYLETAKGSIEGWRNMAGMTAGFAIFIDLMFVALGYWAWSQAGGIQWVGLVAIAIGAFGLLEKIYRRVQ